MARTLPRGTRLVLATHNQGKLREIAALLAPEGVDVVSAGALGLAEPEETEPDFVGNARLKPRFSPVAWISTMSPAPVSTKLASASAALSSS